MTAAYWLWFGVSWVFILAVLFKAWFARERRDAEATEQELKRTAPPAPVDHRWDAMP